MSSANEKAFAKVRTSVVCLTSSKEDVLHTGSGFALTHPSKPSATVIVTCSHVVDMLGGIANVSVQGLPAVEVSPPVGRSQDIRAYDVVLLEAGKLEGVSPLALASRPPKINDPCRLFGWRWLDARLLVGETVLATVVDHTGVFSRLSSAAVGGIKVEVSTDSRAVLRPGFSGAPILVWDAKRDRVVVLGVFSHAANEEGSSGYGVALDFAFGSSLADAVAEPNEVPTDVPENTFPDPNEVLPPIANAVDPNAGRFGASDVNTEEGLALELVFDRWEGDTFWFDAIVRVTTPDPVGPFRFHLYPNYPRPIIWVRRLHPDRTARLEEVSAAGIYTVGVQVYKKGRWIPLEADLRKLKKLPRKFLSR